MLGAALAATVWAYLPALRAGFVLDDTPNILETPGVHWRTLADVSIRRLLTGTPNPRRLVANLTLALNHLAGGLDPRGYHLANLAVHLLMGPTLL